MNKFFRNTSIGTKILTLVLLTCVISLFLIGGVSYKTVENLGLYSKKISNDLGLKIENNSEDALKNQAEDYLKKLTSSISSLSDGVFNELVNNVNSIVQGMEYLQSEGYNEANYGKIPLLPGVKDDNLSKARQDATGQGFIVDRDNSYEDNIFVYNHRSYTDQKDLYKTSPEALKSLSEEERNNIKNKYIITSDSYIPSNLESEMKFIDGFKYFMKSIYDQNKTISSIYLGTESGIVYDYSTYPIKTKYDPKTRPWYKDAVEAYKNGERSGVWQGKYYSYGSGEQCITYSRVYLDSNGNVLGVIAADMYLSDIEKYVVKSKTGETGYTFIIDNNGQIVLSSDDNVFVDYPMESDIDETYRNVLKDMTNGSQGVAKALISGKEYYLAYAPIKTTGWSMGIMTETSEIISPAKQIHEFMENKILESEEVINSEIRNVIFKFAMVLFLVSITASAIGILMSREIVKPLKRLKNGAKRIGSGDLSVKFSVKSSDEVGELANTFNKMTCNLQKYIKDLAETTKEKEKIHSELSIAKKIQLSMLPCIFPAFPDRKDFDIYAIMDPAKEVGGDFYDFFFIDKDNIALVVADVSGKGVSAALFMVISKILIKNQTQSGSLPGKVFEIVNNQLCENNEAGMFVTAFMGILNIKTGEFIYSNAGHNPPIIYRAEEDRFEWIKNEHSFVLAGMKEMKYKEFKTHLSPNDVIYMYTDGVVEAMNSENKPYSNEHLEEVLNSPDVKKMCIKDIIIYLRKSIDEFASGAERSDDITILGAKIMPLENSESEK